jgi:hypothetical protein
MCCRNELQCEAEPRIVDQIGASNPIKFEFEAGEPAVRCDPGNALDIDTPYREWLADLSTRHLVSLVGSAEYFLDKKDIESL